MSESLGVSAQLCVSDRPSVHHVNDHLQYSQNSSWYQEVGYPMVKGIAQFWLTQLQMDAYFDDDTLVVNPCNSPEHGPTTFGCTHYQQLIYELLSNILSNWQASGDSDTKFKSNVASTLSQLDKGLHIGSWGQIQEWKLDLDVENDTHRHLSNLYGWYPGFSLSSPTINRSNNDTNTSTSFPSIIDAVTTTLWSRGPGNGPDANAGWEKVWRSACWSRVASAWSYLSSSSVTDSTTTSVASNSSSFASSAATARDEAYFELRYAIGQNMANNGLSMYSANSTPFQIDMNFGLLGAVTEMLIWDDEGASGTHSGANRTIVLAGSVPDSWAPGSIQGLRIRGGGAVDFSWGKDGSVDGLKVEGVDGVQFVDRYGKVIGS